MPWSHLLWHTVREIAERTPERPALVSRKACLTYCELEQQSNAASHVLAELGVGPGDRVGLLLDKSPDAVVAALGILKRGAAYVPLDMATPKSRHAGILARCGARALVTNGAKAEPVLNELRAAESLPELSGVASPGTGSIDTPDAVRGLCWGDAPNNSAATADVTEQALAYILHTSGSTGQPKGVAISHRNALAFVDAAAKTFAIHEEDVLGAQAPLHFDLSIFDLFCAFRVGAKVALWPDFFSAFPKKYVESIAKDRVTIWNSVVSALALITDRVDISKIDVSSLRSVLFSGEVMPMGVLRKVRNAFPTAALYNVYGQTEANSSLFFQVEDLPNDESAKLPLGRPLPNFETLVIEDELYIRSPTVAAGGYFRQPELTAERFVLDPERPETGQRVYRTGDLVRRNDSGALVFVGRRDHLIKVRGYRVEPDEIELCLRQAPGVRDAVIVAVPDETRGHRLTAFVTEQNNAMLASEELTAFLAARLPKYMLPAPILVRDDLPRTSTGKLDRKLLRAEAEDLPPPPPSSRQKP